MPHPTINSLFVCSLLATSSCGQPDERLLELSRHSLDTQAHQNSQQAEQSRVVAEATRELLVTQQAAAAQQQTRQQQLHEERQHLDQRRETLDRESRELDDARIRDPLVAEALLTISSWGLAALPLILCWLLLRRQSEPPVEPLMAELLLQELTSGPPQAFPAPATPPAIPGSSATPHLPPPPSTPE